VGERQYSVEELGALVGHQTPVLALFVPLALVFIIDGKRGVRQTWVPALVCGVAFAVAQWLTASYFSVPLTDIVAALVGALATVLVLRIWQPTESYSERDQDAQDVETRTAPAGRRVEARDRPGPRP